MNMNKRKKRKEEGVGESREIGDPDIKTAQDRLGGG